MLFLLFSFLKIIGANYFDRKTPIGGPFHPPEFKNQKVVPIEFDFRNQETLVRQIHPEDINAVVIKSIRLML